MRRLLAVATLFVIVAAPALAQDSARPNGIRPVPRQTAATGVTKPPGARYSRASTEADMHKAQRAASARDKAWDSKTRSTMGSICQGC